MYIKNARRPPYLNYWAMMPFSRLECFQRIFAAVAAHPGELTGRELAARVMGRTATDPEWFRIMGVLEMSGRFRGEYDAALGCARYGLRVLKGHRAARE